MTRPNQPGDENRVLLAALIMLIVLVAGAAWLAGRFL